MIIVKGGLIRMDFKPTGVYQTTLEWLNSYYHEPNVINEFYKEYKFDPTNFSQLPKTIEHKVHWKFEYTAKSIPPPAFIVSMENGRILSYNGTIVSPNNQLIWDLSIEFIVSSPDQHYLLNNPFQGQPQYSDEKIAALTFCASQYYYHWLFDVLPRLFLLRYMGIEVDKYAINWNGSPSFQKETLELLGINQDKIITVTEDTNLQVKNLFIPSPSGYTGHMGKWTVNFLRNEFLKKDLTINNNTLPTRIYISRSHASSRRVLNEESIIKLLKPYGFSTVYLETMTVTEQINLFHHAEIIIGAHGSGLSNIAFCKPNTKIVEIFSPNYVHTCYWILSEHIQGDYYYLIGTGERPPEFTDPNAVHQDIQVDDSDFKKILERLNFTGS
jgi:hypothetical protein